MPPVSGRNVSLPDHRHRSCHRYFPEKPVYPIVQFYQPAPQLIQMKRMLLKLWVVWLWLMQQLELRLVLAVRLLAVRLLAVLLLD